LGKAYTYLRRMRNCASRWMLLLPLLLHEAMGGVGTPTALCASANSCESCAGVARETYCYWCQDSGKCMNEAEWLQDVKCKVLVSDSRSCVLTATAKEGSSEENGSSEESDEDSTENDEDLTEKETIVEKKSVIDEKKFVDNKPLTPPVAPTPLPVLPQPTTKPLTPPTSSSTTDSSAEQSSEEAGSSEDSVE